MFHAPSPKNTNRAQLYLNRAGELLDKRGAYWGKSQIMAMDAALKPRRKLAYDVDLSATNVGTGEPKKPHNPLATQARGKLDSAVKAVCDAMGLEHEKLAGQIHDILDEHEREQVQAHAQSLGAGGGRSAGAGALDDTDEDEVEERVREFLRGKGLADDDIEEAIEKVRRDREAAKDRLPVPGPEGRGGHLSGRSKHDVDFDAEYPNNLIDMPDYTPDPNRGLPGVGDPIRERGSQIAGRMAGGGVSRRLAAGDASLRASDEELAREYPGIENVTAGI
jgi:hypothetical protein